MMAKITTIPLSIAMLLLSLDRVASYDKALEQQNLDKNEAKWDSYYMESTGSGCGYVMKYSRICFCMPDYLGPFQVVVNSTHQVVNAVYLAGRDGDLAGTYASIEDMNLITVEDAFETIQKALDENAADLSVTYDPTGGYPSKVSVDWDRRIADEETFFTIENLILL